MPEMGVGILRRRYLRVFETMRDKASTACGAAGRVFVVPIDIPWPVIVDRIIYQVGAAQAGNVIGGIYREGATADSAVGGSLAVESASIAQPAINVVQALTIADTLLIPGQYFLALEFDDVAATFYRYYEAIGTYLKYYTRAGGYGALTDPCPTLSGITIGPCLTLRVKTNLPLGQQM